MTQAGFMDCKKVLDETNGDLKAAVALLRERGLAKAAKRAGRSTNEGLVVVKKNSAGTAAAAVMLTCETDFVSRNDDFKKLADKLADLALEKKANSVAELEGVAFEGHTVGETVKNLVGTIGENIQLADVAYVAVTNGVAAAYVHFNGKIGVLVGIQTTKAASKPEVLAELGNDLGMHAAAAAPKFLNPTAVDAATIASEREIYKNKAVNEGKPAQIIDKIVESGVKKYYEENCLSEQFFVKDAKMTIKQLLDKKGKDLGDTLTLTSFRRLAIGEGAPKAEES